MTFDGEMMSVTLSDGRTLGIPLSWFPRLLSATVQQREAYRISRRGLHWDELDEDISLPALLAGQGDMTASVPRVAE